MPDTLKKYTGQVRIVLVLQLISGISRVLQKLLRYFNDTVILTCFSPSLPVSPVLICLDLNNTILFSAGKSITVSLASKAGSSL